MNKTFKNFLELQRDGMYHLANAGVIGLHMVSGPLVGFALGYGIDYLFDTHPFGKIIFLLLGICGGFLNVYRDTQILLAKMAKNDQSTKEPSSYPKDSLNHAENSANPKSRTPS